MTSIPTVEFQAEAADLLFPAARAARWVSTVISPRPMAAAGLVIVASVVNTAAGWRWALAEFGLAFLASMGHIVWLVQRRQVQDYELPVRAQRLRPYLTLAAGALAGWLILWLGQAPALLTVFAGALVLQARALLLITCFWKISLHTTAAASVVTLLYLFAGTPALPLLGLVPLVAWSRVRLRRHTLAQTVAGALLGAGVVLSVLGHGG